MENDSQYITSLTESSSVMDGELTIVEDDDGEMVLDISQILANVADQSKEGSLVIITTDDNNSTITYTIPNMLQENTCDISLPFQSDFVAASTLALPCPDLNKVINFQNF